MASFGTHLALTAVPAAKLKIALKSLHRGQLECPLTIAGLTCIGLQDFGSHLLNHCRGLDKNGVRAVLVAVIAERNGE